MKEDIIYIRVNEALNFYNQNKGKKMTLAKLGEIVFKGEKEKTPATMEQMLSGWNNGDHSKKACTVEHCNRICKFTGYDIDILINIQKAKRDGK